MLFFKSYKDAGWYQNADINDDVIMALKDLGIAAKHLEPKCFDISSELGCRWRALLKS